MRVEDGKMMEGIYDNWEQQGKVVSSMKQEGKSTKITLLQNTMVYNCCMLNKIL